MTGTELYTDNNGKKFISVAGTGWFTNIELGKRHLPLQLMTMEDNLRYSKHTEIKEKGYEKFDHYDAINIPFTDAIPSNYNGMMGVPISFLPKYNPDQFEIINGIGRYACIEDDYTNPIGTYGTDIKGEHTYFRILIRWKKDGPGFIKTNKEE